ncbi:hypothetical protein KI387_031146, partial [Taxus chinensis]
YAVKRVGVDRNKVTGFCRQVYKKYETTIVGLGVVLISATLPHEILEMTNKFMTDPVRILVKCDELTLEGIKQFFIAVEREEWKFDTLCDVYDTLTITQAVIFCNTKRKFRLCMEICHKKEQDAADKFLSLDLSSVLSIYFEVHLHFTFYKVQVSLVINYDLPNNRELYIHRIRRSGRFGRKGVAINFVQNDDIRILRDIEQYYSTQICHLSAMDLLYQQ